MSIRSCGREGNSEHRAERLQGHVDKRLTYAKLDHNIFDDQRESLGISNLQRPFAPVVTRSRQIAVRCSSRVVE